MMHDQSDAMAVVFLHGAGSSGPTAWPVQVAEADDDWVFLDRREFGDDATRDASRIIDILRPQSGGHVVAASFGGNAAVLAAQSEPDLVYSLALFEPACFDLARGKPVVEEHIAAMTPVFAAADDPTVDFREFSRLFAGGMGTPALDVPDDVLEREVAKLRALRPPWGTAVNAEAGLPVPTLVVTGGWSILYDDIAEAMAELGAERSVISGHGHRPQDADGANELLRKFWSHH